MRSSAPISQRILSPTTALLLFLQAAVVVTGGGVRLTVSGLGCPTWPRCTPGSFIPVPGQAEGQLHAWIEFANRLLTIVLILSALIALVAVIKAGRRDILLLAAGQFLGIFGQGILGGVTVLTHLNPIAVASHYLLSTVLIAAATSLYSRRRHPFKRKIAPQKINIFSRTHVTLTAFVVILGTVVTGTGPHAGDINSPRLHLDIQLTAIVHGCAVAILLALTIIFFFTKDLNHVTKSRLLIFFIISLAQGALGVIQYLQGVPQLMVAAHLAGSTLVWIGAWRVWLSVHQEEMENVK